MRDLVFKNLTSQAKKRRIIASTEVMDQQGVRSVIRRHFVYMIKEVKDNQAHKPDPYIYVLKERNNRAQRERFFCKIKSSVYAVNNDKLFLVMFMHTLHICLTTVPKDLMQCSE